MKHTRLLLLLLAVGCTRVDSGSGGASAGPVKRTDPWPVAAAELGRTPDLVTARRVLNQLNNELDAQGTPLPVMAQGEVEKLAPRLNPSEDEAKEWTAKSFTSMDANYLAECLFFKQVAESLDVADQPPAVKAKAAFDWVCRQMYLRQWTMGRNVMPPVPPQVALRRGYGNGAEREAAFIALARQLGLDPVLVGPPANEAKARFDGKSQRGAVWAVGIRDGGDVLLFDPWLGEPMPAKLSEAKANPKLITDWINAKKSPLTVGPEEIASAVAYFTAPVNALTPRMKELEAKAGVKVFAAVPEGPVYSPPADVDAFSIPHGLGYFTPKLEGGYDPKKADPNQLAFLAREIEPVVPAIMPAPPELKNEVAREQFRQRVAGAYKVMLVDSGLREKQQRGQFNEVVKQLGDLDRGFATLKERVRAEATLLRDWAESTSNAHDALAMTNLAEHAAKRPEVQNTVNLAWNMQGPAGAAVQNAVADLAATDVAYLFALCKHEQAERSQTRYRKSGDAIRAARDWEVAKDAWQRFQSTGGKFEAQHPGRNDHAKKLADRAGTLAANPQERP